MWDLWWTRWHWGGFVQLLQFPLPILLPPNAPYSSIIWDWYNRPISSQRTEWSLTPSHKITKKLHESASCMRKILIVTLYKVKTHFRFNSCVGVFLWDIVTWWMRFWILYTVTQSQIQLASPVMAPVWGRIMGSAPSDSCKNYCMVGGNIWASQMFLNNSINMVIKMSISWMRIPDAWKLDWACTVLRDYNN
jgi:hypothetical protein